MAKRQSLIHTSDLSQIVRQYSQTKISLYTKFFDPKKKHNVFICPLPQAFLG